MRRLSLTLFILSLAIASQFSTNGNTQAQTRPQKPNILVILADDLGYADIGVQGCQDVPTPHIDSLARNGVRFTNGYVSGPYCSPTRAALLTGRYQQRYGHEFNPGPAQSADPEFGLPLTEATLADRMDDNIGRVLETLRKHKLEQNTLIFFLSDNGGPTRSNGSRNTPLRGFKAQTWDGGVRIPFIVQWRGTIPEGKVYADPVIQLDVLPTALAAAGSEIKSEWKLDGVNLLPYLQGKKKTPHEALFWRFGAQMAVRMGDWKLVKAPGSGAEFAEGRSAATATGAHLYNLAKDAGEQTNLADHEPERVKQLSAVWTKWNSELEEPRWTPNRGRRNRNR